MYFDPKTLVGGVNSFLSLFIKFWPSIKIGIRNKKKQKIRKNYFFKRVLVQYTVLFSMSYIHDSNWPEMNLVSCPGLWGDLSVSSCDLFFPLWWPFILRPSPSSSSSSYSRTRVTSLQSSFRSILCFLFEAWYWLIHKIGTQKGNIKNNTGNA